MRQEDSPHRHRGQPSVKAFFNVHVLLLSALLNPSMNNFELDTKSDKGSPAARARRRRARQPSRRHLVRSAYPPNSLPSATKGMRTMILGSRHVGCLWDWLLFEFGIVSFALYVRLRRFQRAECEGGGAGATTRPSRPSTSSSRIRASTSLRACSRPRHCRCIAAAAPAPAPSEARSGGRLRCGGGRPFRRRSRGSTRRAAASVSARSVGRRRYSRVVVVCTS